MKKLRPRRRRINACASSCTACGAVIVPLRVCCYINGVGLLCAACAPDFLRRRRPRAEVEVRVSGDGMPPWQAQDRAWFAARPGRFLRLRPIMRGEEAALPLWPGWQHPEVLSAPARAAIAAIGQAVVTRAPGWQDEPDGPGFAVLVIAYSPDHRERVTIPALPRPVHLPSTWDALARDAERRTSPPSAEHLAAILARRERGLIAQATHDAEEIVLALRGGDHA